MIWDDYHSFYGNINDVLTVANVDLCILLILNDVFI